MNYSIKKKIIKYYKSKDSLVEYLSEIEKRKFLASIERHQIIGLTNEVWQNWSHIFRSFWLTYYYGGDTLLGNVTPNILNIPSFSTNDDEATALIKIIPQRNKSIMPFYAEKTWGSRKCLTEVSNLHSNLTRANVISSSISLYGDYLEDFQHIRNTMIHLTESSFLDLKNYFLSRNYNSPQKYYPHNHPVNFFYYRIGVSTNLVYEDIFEQLDSMIETIFIINPDI